MIFFLDLCPLPPEVDNAVATFTNLLEGAKANYTCHLGYRFGDWTNHRQAVCPHLVWEKVPLQGCVKGKYNVCYLIHMVWKLGSWQLFSSKYNHGGFWTFYCPTRE